MTPEDYDILLIRVDERVNHLVKQMDNHLYHHQLFEEVLERRLDELTARNVFSPVITLFKWLFRK